MITFDIFLEQCNKNLFNKKDKSDVFYYLLKNRYKNPKLELKKFTNDECKDMKTFLKYDFSSYRKKRGDKFIPILEEVKFKEVILEMPDNGTVNWCLMPSGIIIDEIYGNKKEIKTPSGTYNNIRKFKLLIPKKYIKNKQNYKHI